MGYDVSLVPKTRDQKILHQIYACKDKESKGFLSRDFAMFQSRNFENCEINQVQELLQIDLEVYTRFPANFIFDEGELSYQKYLAEEAADQTKIAAIKTAIEKERMKWETTYEEVNEGWSTTEEFRTTTLALIGRIQQNPDFGKQVIPPVGWSYNWGDYFSASKQYKNLLVDLEIVLADLDCMEKFGITRVAFWGN